MGWGVPLWNEDTVHAVGKMCMLLLPCIEVSSNVREAHKIDALRSVYTRRVSHGSSLFTTSATLVDVGGLYESFVVA